MFEVFNVPKVLLMNKSTLSLYSCGKTTGLVVDSGYESTQVIPIYEGYPISHAMRNMPVGGWHLTQFLKQMINSRGYSLTTTRDWERIKHMKQTFCYCAIDFQKELSMYGKDKEQRYTLPDGMIVNINNEALVFYYGLISKIKKVGQVDTTLLYSRYQLCHCDGCVKFNDISLYTKNDSERIGSAY